MKMKVGTKIALSFGVIIALMLFMAMYSLNSLTQTKEDLTKINGANARMALADDIVLRYNGAVSDIRAYVAYGDEGQVAKVESKFNNVLTLEKELLALARTEKKQDVQKLMDETTKYKTVIMAEYLPVARQYHAEFRMGKFAEAQVSQAALVEIAKRMAPQSALIEKMTEELSTSNAEVAKSLITESVTAANRVVTTSIILSVVALLFGTIIAFVLTRMIHKPIIELTSIANQYANADLRQRVTIKTSDEIGELADSLRSMHTHFVEMITTIRLSAEHLAAASEEMAASTEEVTATSEAISQNMQTLSKDADAGNESMLTASQALVQLSSLIQMAKVRAEYACKNSEKTLVAAEDGRIKVDQSVIKMDNIKNQTENSSKIIGELNDYSQQISQITDTITKLAKQTNLLALNAAIEAARAGEHGRGFAVVAEEVRKLAEQSDHGAQEITSLVNKVTEKTDVAVATMAQNVSEVGQGVSTVNEAGLALDRILQAVNQTTNETKQIGNLTSEEVANSEQIVKLIDHLATVIETVAAHGEEVTASAEEQAAAMQTVAASAEQTSAMALELKNSVAKFIV